MGESLAVLLKTLRDARPQLHELHMRTPEDRRKFFGVGGQRAFQPAQANRIPIQAALLKTHRPDAWIGQVILRIELKSGRLFGSH
jgi:hypothetical protein